MISRVITLGFSIALWFCLDGSPQARAQVGHTIRNGGGKAEMQFARIWRSLQQQFAACTHAANPCGLSEKTRGLISGLMKFKGECFPTVGFGSLASSTLSQGACGGTLTVNANFLYRGEEAISDSEMKAFALSILQQRSCEGSASTEDFAQVVIAAESVRYFNVVEIGGTNYFVKSLANGNGGEVLTARVNALEVDVNALIRKKFPKYPENVNFHQLTGYIREGRLDIRGEVIVPGGKVHRFFVSFAPNLDVKTAFVYLL